MPQAENDTHFSRQAWIASCHFHDADDAAVLRRVIENVQSTERPVMLLDLDSTLYDTSPRTHTIIREWSEAHAGDIPKSIRDAIARIKAGTLSYSLHDLFRTVGLDCELPEVASAIVSAKAFWQTRFFSNEYLRHDRPYEGAAEFVRALLDAGAKIVYLTGRDSPGMLLGTVANLRRDGFPTDAVKTRLVMKPQREGDDYQYKVGVAASIREMGNLVASFENEPKNLMGLYEAFPDSIHVFVETVCSESPAPRGRGLYKLRGFPICS